MRFFFRLIVLAVFAAASALALPSVAQMEALGRRAAGGDRKAVDEIESIASKLYRGLNATDNRAEYIVNLELMRSAFDEIARGVKNPTAEDAAFQSLVYAVGYQQLRSFAAGAVGIAAANGHEPSLDVLLDYKKQGILVSTVVFALQKSAQNGQPDAIDILLAVLADDTHRALWHAAAQGLIPAAKNGNAQAQAAIDKFADYQKDRAKTRRPKVEPQTTVGSLTSTPATKPTSESASSPKPVFYAVQTGDTAARIARSHKVSIKDIKALNPEVDFSRLEVGQKVRVN